jgi:hypothetical protein
MPRIRLSLTEHPKEFHEFHPIGGVAAMGAVVEGWPPPTRTDAIGADVARAGGTPAPAAMTALITAVDTTNRRLRFVDMGCLQRSAVPITHGSPH